MSRDDYHTQFLVIPQILYHPKARFKVYKTYNIVYPIFKQKVMGKVVIVVSPYSTSLQ